MAPAIMVGDELIVQGCDIDEEKLEAAICRQLGLPEPEKKGILDRLFGDQQLSDCESVHVMEREQMLKVKVFVNDPSGKT